MEKIAAAKGFDTRDLLLGSDATYALVTARIYSASAQLEAGDIFLFTFAGHGFQKVDRDRDEPDRLDETILLYDVELRDDVLRKELWPRFNAGVRVLMIADSCHSGSVFLIPPDPADPAANEGGSNLNALIAAEAVLAAINDVDEFAIRTRDGLIARTILHSTHGRHMNEYGEFYRNTLLPADKPPINASLLLLAACADNEVTGDGPDNGVFTTAMLNVLRNSDPTSYCNFRNLIEADLQLNGHTQTPVLQSGGVIDPAFRDQRPFTID
jgi:hypothetical protein